MAVARARLSLPDFLRASQWEFLYALREDCSVEAGFGLLEVQSMGHR